MKRYTRYFKHCMAIDKNGTEHYQEGIYIENGGDRKLFDLENLEEELGIDLITLFKALKNRVYVLNDEYNKSSCLVGLSYGFNHEIKNWSLLGFAYGYEAEEWLSLKDYGKTWALTKEELGKEETPVEEKMLVDFYKAVDPIKWWLKHNCSFVDATVIIAQKKDGNITIDFQFEEN